jgi:hypothetical protein
MTAQVHQPAVVEVAHATPQVHRLITGTMTGTTTFIPNMSNPNNGKDTYDVSGTSNVGSASVKGKDRDMSTLTTPSIYNDLLYFGNWTMTMKYGAKVKISYVGSGYSPAVAGPYAGNLEGVAIGVSGALAGQVMDFSASYSGMSSSSTAPVTIKFTLTQ